MRLNIVSEHFDSIEKMISVTNARENNSVMNGKKSSDSNGRDFSLTASYKEATDLFRNGYLDKLSEIKTGVETNLKSLGKVDKMIPRNSVVGYVPNVPNAIRNIPESMIRTDRISQKVKAVNLIYAPTGNCKVESSEFVKCGVVLMSMINTLEIRGMRINLEVAFYTAKERDEVAFGCVKVKDFREHLDIQKLCFPVIHPSMFRRLGFKWLETCIGLKDSGWAYGYGRQMKSNEINECNLIDKNSIYVDMEKIKSTGYDVDKLIKNLNFA